MSSSTTPRERGTAPILDPDHPPELTATRWLGADAPISLASLRGRVAVVTAFQMLCPGCVSQGLPQARRLRAMFNPETVAVVGLHTVFEHHDVMTPAALEVFLHEYRWGFPVGIDEPQGRGLPRTMEAYAMRGTPTLLIFDRTGRLRRHYFGHLDDLVLGAEVMAMVVEDDGRKTEQRLRQALALPDHRRHAHAAGESCDDEGCG